MSSLYVLCWSTATMSDGGHGSQILLVKSESTFQCRWPATFSFAGVQIRHIQSFYTLVGVFSALSNCWCCTTGSKTLLRQLPLSVALIDLTVHCGLLLATYTPSQSVCLLAWELPQCKHLLSDESVLIKLLWSLTATSLPIYLSSFICLLLTNAEWGLLLSDNAKLTMSVCSLTMSVSL